MIKKTLGELLKSLMRFVFWFREEHNIFRSSAVEEAYRLAKIESGKFILENISKANCFTSREKLWRQCLSGSDPEGLFLELGVNTGSSINKLSEMLETFNPSQKFYGLDSFEGLQESMVGSFATKGHFDKGGKLPKVRDSVILIKGWVQDTLIPLLEQKNSNISFMHLDVDTYESTKFVLDAAVPWMKEGCIIVFDDYLMCPGWQYGQHRSLVEFGKETGTKFDYIGFSRRQAAIQIK